MILEYRFYKVNMKFLMTGLIQRTRNLEKLSVFE